MASSLQESHFKALVAQFQALRQQGGRFTLPERFRLGERCITAGVAWVKLGYLEITQF